MDYSSEEWLEWSQHHMTKAFIAILKSKRQEQLESLISIPADKRDTMVGRIIQIDDVLDTVQDLAKGE